MRYIHGILEKKTKELRKTHHKGKQMYREYLDGQMTTVDYFTSNLLRYKSLKL